MEEHKHFYNSIENNTDTIVNLSDGVEAVALVEKVLIALDSKKIENI